MSLKNRIARLEAARWAAQEANAPRLVWVRLEGGLIVDLGTDPESAEPALKRRWLGRPPGELPGTWPVNRVSGLDPHDMFELRCQCVLGCMRSPDFVPGPDDCPDCGLRRPECARASKPEWTRVLEAR